jgi:FixJ family two-component response regulator
LKKPADPVIYVVDDDDALRDSLRWLLESAGYRVADFSSTEPFLDAFEPGAAACLLLDVRMPGMSGIELQEQLLRRDQRIPIIFITGHGDVPMAVGAIKRGAFDFIEKPFRDDELLARIRSAIAVECRGTAQQQAAASRLATLSRRERDVMEGAVAGKPNKIIADELGISIKTVEAHRARMMGKLGVSSIAELVRLVLGAGGGSPGS